MAAPTPGPWKTYAGSIWSESPTIDKSKRCNTVASISPRWRMPDAEKDANAKLIAAAPELLALLQRIITRDPLNDCYPFWEHDTKALLARIAGETEQS